MRLHPNGLAVASYRHQTLNYRRFLLRKLALLAVMSGFFILACFAQAQQADAMFGFGTVVSPGASPCNVDATTGQVTCPEQGGLYTNIGADLIFHRRIGFASAATLGVNAGNYS